MIEIPKKAIEKIIEWNGGATRDHIEYDKKICRSLLLSLVAKDNLRSFNVDNNVMEFIKCNIYLFVFFNINSINLGINSNDFFQISVCFFIRCGQVNTEERIASIETYKMEFCAIMDKAKTVE